MAQIPLMVGSLPELEALLADGEPGRFVLTAIDPVGEAPLFHAVVKQLRAQGWRCLNIVDVARTASFATTLHRLAAEVLPVLLHDARDLAALRSLRSCGQAALRVRRGSEAGPADLYAMAGRFSNSLERKARQALGKLETYTIPLEWMVAKANEVELTSASRVGLEHVAGALLAPALPHQLPLYVVSNMQDIDALGLLPDLPPRQITILSVQFLLDAPIYHHTVSQKAGAGWMCPTLPQLHQASRFAGRLADLGESILPLLMDNAENRDELRRLRACGQGIWKIRRHAQGVLADMMGRYSNALTRAARGALRTGNATLSLDWLYQVAEMVLHDRYCSVSF